MSIRIGCDEFLTLLEASKRLPVKNSGKRVHVGALYRWASIGCRGVVLETIQIGGQRFTSVDALQRFGEELSERARRADRPARPPISSWRVAEIERSEAAVGRELSGRNDRRARSERLQ